MFPTFISKPNGNVRNEHDSNEMCVMENEPITFYWLQ